MEAWPRSKQVHTHTSTRTYILIWVVTTQASTFAEVYRALYFRFMHFLGVSHTSINSLGEKGVIRSRVAEQLRLWVLELYLGLNPHSSTNQLCDDRQVVGLCISVSSLVRSG